MTRRWMVLILITTGFMAVWGAVPLGAAEMVLDGNAIMDAAGRRMVVRQPYRRIISTFGYIVRHLKADWPHLAIRTVPGITSYQAAAAAMNRPLVEGEESLLIMSSVQGGERFQRLAEKPDNVAFLKAYRHVDGIRQALEAADMLADSVAVAHCSRENEKIYTDLRSLAQQQPKYWTLIMAQKKRGGYSNE